MSSSTGNGGYALGAAIEFASLHQYFRGTSNKVECTRTHRWIAALQMHGVHYEAHFDAVCRR